MDAREEQVADVCGKLEIVELPSVPGSVTLPQPARSNQRLDRLLEKERVSASGSVQHPREFANGVLGRAEHAAKQLGRGALREARELLRARETNANERLLGRSEHLVVLTVRRAVGTENGDSRAGELARGEVQQLERQRIGPVQVLEYDQQRRLLGIANEELQEGPEQSRLQLGRIANDNRRTTGRCIARQRREEQCQLCASATRQSRER